MSPLRLLSRTKLYWGLAIICLIGALASPHTSSGRNIFLSTDNLTDVLRQVSITGLVATGMTIVILLGGIDLSVGSVMGFSTIICAMLLTQPGWTPAAIMGVPAAAIVTGLAVGFLARFVFNGLERGRDIDAGRRREIVLGPWRGYRIPAAARPCRRRRRRRGRGVAGSHEIRRPGGAFGDAVRRARCLDRSTARSSSPDASSPSSRRWR